MLSYSIVLLDIDLRSMFPEACELEERKKHWIFVLENNLMDNIKTCLQFYFQGMSISLMADNHKKA